jgi:hypothetical protein
VLVKVLVSVVALLVGSLIFLLPPLRTHAATDNTDCTLIVPAHPLSARGLATPYQLAAVTPAQGPCHEADGDQSAFVQAAILDPATGTIAVYSPLVIDQGTQAIQPTVVPHLPQHAVVGIWFGFNGNNLKLIIKNTTRRTHLFLRGDLAGGNCVNGLNGSIFGQFSYCNAPAFFQAAGAAIRAGKLTPPVLQKARDGLPCPTTRDFSVVDQDQSDNVQTQYLVTATGQTAQFTAANQAQLPSATILSNPSDNGLLTRFLDPALGCQPWQAPDLANNNAMVSALALDELQAAADQQAPIALVPLTDPMTLDGTTQSLAKTNLYRIGVDQMPAADIDQASGTTYCQNLLNTGLPRLKLDRPWTSTATTPIAAVANSLFTFLAQRFQASYDMLNCPQLLNMPNPVTTQTDANGVVISATFNGQGSDPPAPTTGATPIPSPAATVDGQATSTPPPTTGATPIPSPSATVGGQATSTPVPPQTCPQGLVGTPPNCQQLPTPPPTLPTPPQ